MSESKSCTLIIPAYNESSIIEDTLKEINSYFSQTVRHWEIIVVNDGSTDNTQEIAEASIGNGRIIQRATSGGKAAAIVEGVMATTTDYLVFTDADLSVPLSFLEAIVSPLESSEVVIGSRRLEGSEIIVHQPWLREKCGEVFRRIVRATILPGVSDYTCGMKGFRTDAAKILFKDLTCLDWTYDVEILLRAAKNSYQIYEIPISWANRLDSRVRLLRAIFGSLLSLIRLFLTYGRFHSKIKRNS